MSGLATRLGRSGSRSTSRRGSALAGTLAILVSLLGLLYLTSRLSAVELKDTRNSVGVLQAKHVAEAGVERGLNFLAQAVKHTTIVDPLYGLNHLFEASPNYPLYNGEALVNGTTRVGAYSVRLTRVDSTPTSITIAVDASGYLPDAPAALPAGRAVDAWDAVHTLVKYELAPSKVFDYGYFINNWGWFYGDSIICRGNVRSNGQFDVAGYAPTITGQPLYDSVAWDGTHAALSGYHDDNGDGLSDGNDGGVWSGWDIIGASHLQGNGGHASNQHDYQDAVPMPNLSDLSVYEASALQQHGSITIDGVQVCDAVCGDGAGEKQNLFLVGTNDHPITLHGPVVVRGSVIISGVVTGQGAIYSGGNVYCPQSVTYKNPPSTPRPVANTQAATESWMSANWNKDFLGLFARENVVVGDFTDATWQFYESWWMSASMNSSVEDAGADGIPNTRRGRDGILGTADDDVLEGDGVFTISHYTEADLAAGLIPPGHNVGDPIPGTGEDIDGDGVYDPAETLSNVICTIPLNNSNWSGNIPASGISSYHSIASMRANQLDAVIYTNHGFCWTVLGSSSAVINGALVSRNENIVYGTPSMDVNYDTRLLGGASGMASRFLPLAVQAGQILQWKHLDQDPNRYGAAP